VGLYDDRRLVLPRTTDVQNLLSTLLDREPVPDDLPAPVASALDALLRNGCVLPVDLLHERSRMRARARVAVVGRLPGPDPADLAAQCGFGTTSSADDADVVLVLAGCELAREVVDPLVRRGTSHLVVRLVDGGAVLGPFTVPGRTACLRCIDAHRTVPDPDHVAVTTRYVRASAPARADGVPDLTDPALVSLTVAWAVRDLAAWVEGREPSTWSRTIHLGADLTYRLERPWLRHPQCGCSWSAEPPTQARWTHDAPSCPDREGGTP
jgi:bacteriocin biosynthesis cyclodehydratase domain-containing protein